MPVAGFLKYAVFRSGGIRYTCQNPVQIWRARCLILRLKKLVTILIFFLLCVLLARATPDGKYLQEQQFKQLLVSFLSEARAHFGQQALSFSPLSRLPDTALQDMARQHLQQYNQGRKLPPQPLLFELQLSKQRLNLVVTTPDRRFQFQRAQPAIHWWSALPPLIAIVATLLSQRLVFSLLLGIFMGALIDVGLNLWQAPPAMFAYLYHVASEPSHVKILLFGAILLGMVGVMNACGGTRGLVEAFRRYTRSRFSTLLMASSLGVLLFFDDYAHCFILGGTLRPVTDRQKISREKLAFIVDATAATMASLALVSTWIGYQVGLLQDALRSVSLTMGGYQAFVLALPFRFYCWLMVVLLFLLVWMRRDFGPMYRAERRALAEGLVIRPGAVPMTSSQFHRLEAREDLPARWYNAALPILTMIAVTVVGLYIHGGGWAQVQAQPMKIFSFQVLSDSFSQADSGLVLLIASSLGSVVALLLALGQRLLRFKEALLAWIQGATSVWLALSILVLAWSLSRISQEIGTATYVIAIFRDLLHPAWVPCLVFILAAATAFAVGSSWSTMAILVPMAVPLAYELGGPALMVVTMGAVLDGAIFGDHCSPLTDTSVLSSMACASDHLDHIRTQLPYGLLTLTTAAWVGYLPAGFGLLPLFSLLLGAAILWLIIRLIGRNPEEDLLEPHTATPVPNLRPEPVETQRYSQE